MFEISILSLLFGITMKFGDLLNEHGLRLFKGDKIIFGIIWGVVGSALLLSNNSIFIFLLALSIHWILRYRIDCLTHGIAMTIILLTYIYAWNTILHFDQFLFLSTLIVFSLHGLLNDSADRGEITGIVSSYFKSNIHWVLFPIVISTINPLYMSTLVMSTLFIVSYELVKEFAKRKGYE